jgi:hypothetical protein
MSKWIPASEPPPVIIKECDTDVGCWLSAPVLIWCRDDTSAHIGYHLEWYDADDNPAFPWIYEGDGLQEAEVTHWMPLPKRPIQEN